MYYDDLDGEYRFAIHLTYDELRAAFIMARPKGSGVDPELAVRVVLTLGQQMGRVQREREELLEAQKNVVKMPKRRTA